ncbi:MAG: helix-turn-helix domain-containing protein [Chlorobium sp.]
MQIRPIKTEQDYQQALNRLEEIFTAKPNTIEGDELEILGILIENYEEEHFSVDSPDPIEAIKFRMDQIGLDQQDLTNIIGSKSRTSDLLNRKRPLSVRQIRLLHNELHIPADVLLKLP